MNFGPCFSGKPKSISLVAGPSSTLDSAACLGWEGATKRFGLLLPRRLPTRPAATTLALLFLVEASPLFLPHDRPTRDEFIANDRGNGTTPILSRINTVRVIRIGGAKRLIGRRFINPSVQSDINLCPFKAIFGSGGKPINLVQYMDDEKQFAVEEISYKFLIKMREIAEACVDTTTKNVVVTVPA
ncbi:hypothetical protein EJB05_25601, partial [Eragrostis curvula]